jgi:hypothetical protein
MLTNTSGSEQCPLNEVLREPARLRDQAKIQLLDIVWHDIGRVRRLHEDVLRINLGNIEGIARTIATRHDIVHRNGRQKDGTSIAIDTPRSPS